MLMDLPHPPNPSSALKFSNFVVWFGPLFFLHSMVPKEKAMLGVEDDHEAHNADNFMFVLFIVETLHA